MSNATVERQTLRLGDEVLVSLPDFPLAAGAKVLEGLMVALDAAGHLVDGGAGTAAQVIGIADRTVDNTGGAAKAVSAPVRRGAHKFNNSGANPLTSSGDTAEVTSYRTARSRL